MRLGYVVLPPDLIDKFTALKPTVDDYSPLIGWWLECGHDGCGPMGPLVLRRRVMET